MTAGSGPEGPPIADSPPVTPLHWLTDDPARHLARQSTSAEAGGSALWGNCGATLPRQGSFGGVWLLLVRTEHFNPREDPVSMRLQELHPALVHFPIALLPTTIGIDAVGRATGNETLLSVGKVGIAATAGSAVISALAGLLAQEASRFDAESRDLLITHRNLNLGLIGLTGWMAVQRAKRKEPSLRYLISGLAGIGMMTYSAYLGGKMVYQHGVGVSEARGLREAEAPHLVPEAAGEAARISAGHVASGLRHTAEDLARGEMVPWITRGRRSSRSVPGADREERVQH
jgi:uncharacterized membrane protein